MWLCLILIFVSRVEASGSKAIADWKALLGPFSDCAGMGCRWFYPHYDFGAVTAGNKVPWDDRFKNEKDDKPADRTPKGLKQKEWEDAIDKFWPANGASKQTLLQLDKTGAVLTPEKSAISLAAIKNIWATLEEILDKAVEGKKYKNTYSGERGINDLNMHDINQMFVQPSMRGLQAAFATAIQDYKFNKAGKIDASGAPAAGHIDHFISHDWAAPFSNFVKTAEAHCKEVNGGADKCDPSKNYYWVCTFANKQFGFTVDSYDKSPFYIALQANPAPKSILAIQHDGTTEADSNLSIGRIWCVFEMHLVAVLVNSGKKLHWSVGCGDKITQLKSGAKSTCTNAAKVFTSWKDGWSPVHAGVSANGVTDKSNVILPYITNNDLCEAYGFKKDATDTGSVPGDSNSHKCMAAWWGKFFGAGLPTTGALATKLTVGSSVELHTASNFNEHPERTGNSLAQNSEESAKVSATSELGSFQFDSPSFTFLYGIATGVSIAAVISFYKFKQQHKGDEIAYDALLENEC